MLQITVNEAAAHWYTATRCAKALTFLKARLKYVLCFLQRTYSHKGKHTASSLLEYVLPNNLKQEHRKAARPWMGDCRFVS
jgi:hypothetical protein